MKIIKNCLESNQVEIKINYLEKNEIVIDRIKEIKVLSSIKFHKEFMKNNKSILKLQRRFKNETQKAFTEEINKISQSSNDD